MGTRTQIPIVVALALLVAACGSDDTGAGSDAPGSDAQSPSEEAPADDTSDAAGQPSEEGPADDTSGSDAQSSSEEGPVGETSDAGGQSPSEASSDEALGEGGASASSSEASSDEALGEGGASASSSEDTPGAFAGGVPADADLTDSVSAGSSDDIGFSDGFSERNTEPFNSGEPAPPLESRSPAAISDVQFQVMESWPMQVDVIVSGDLPTPCHDLWWEVDIEGNAYDIKVWSVDGSDDTSTACAMVLEPFVESIFLGGGFVDEDYTVTVNGEEHPLNF